MHGCVGGISLSLGVSIYYVSVLRHLACLSVAGVVIVMSCFFDLWLASCMLDWTIIGLGGLACARLS